MWKKIKSILGIGSSNQYIADPMQGDNILIIASKARTIEKVLDKLDINVSYSESSDIIRLDNGDYAIVVKEMN